MLLVTQLMSPTPARTPSSTPNGGIDSNKRPAAEGSCLIFLQHGYCRVKRCGYCHDPTDLAAPVARSTGDNRHGSASSEIAKSAARRTSGNRNGLGGQRNGSTSRVSHAEMVSSSRVCCTTSQTWQRRRPRWHKGGSGSSGGGGTASTSSSG